MTSPGEGPTSNPRQHTEVEIDPSVSGPLPSPGEGERKQEFTDDPDHAKPIEEYVPASRLEAAKSENADMKKRIDADFQRAVEWRERCEALESALRELVEAMEGRGNPYAVANALNKARSIIPPEGEDVGGGGTVVTHGNAEDALALGQSSPAAASAPPEGESKTEEAWREVRQDIADPFRKRPAEGESNG